jgi:quercetin dioxygenase-like cupin family protein
MRRVVIMGLAAGALTGCGQPVAPRGQVYTTLREPVAALWTPAEQERAVAERPLLRTPEASTALLRLTGAEPPRRATHDRVLVVLSGVVHLHVGEVVHVLRPGDVAQIPRGTVHWAENRDAGASELYVVSFPPDARPTAPPTP